MATKNKKPASSSAARRFGEKLEYTAREAFNSIRTNIGFVLPDVKNGRVIGITSSTPKDGKTTVSVNLAYTLAKGGSKVLLVDADMRRPAVSKYLKLKGLPGLSHVLSTTDEPEVYDNVLVEGLDILGAGSPPPNPSELIASEAMKEFIEKERVRYDYVIIDLPPVVPVVDSVAVAKYLDGIVMVVRHALTRKREIVASVSNLEFSKVKILGFIYNAYRSGLGGGYYASKKYGYRRY